jgi:hypothetical protein
VQSDKNQIRDQQIRLKEASVANRMVSDLAKKIQMGRIKKVNYNNNL